MQTLCRTSDEIRIPVAIVRGCRSESASFFKLDWLVMIIQQKVMDRLI